MASRGRMLKRSRHVSSFIEESTENATPSKTTVNVVVDVHNEGEHLQRDNENIPVAESSGEKEAKRLERSDDSKSSSKRANEAPRDRHVVVTRTRLDETRDRVTLESFDLIEEIGVLERSSKTSEEIEFFPEVKPRRRKQWSTMNVTSEAEDNLKKQPRKRWSKDTSVIRLPETRDVSPLIVNNDIENQRKPVPAPRSNVRRNSFFFDNPAFVSENEEVLRIETDHRRESTKIEMKKMSDRSVNIEDVEETRTSGTSSDSLKKNAQKTSTRSKHERLTDIDARSVRTSRSGSRKNSSGEMNSSSSLGKVTDIQSSSITYEETSTDDKRHQEATQDRLLRKRERPLFRKKDVFSNEDKVSSSAKDARSIADAEVDMRVRKKKRKKRKQGKEDRNKGKSDKREEMETKYISVTVHRTDLLEADYANAKRPMVKVHIVDARTGNYLRNTDNRENTSVFLQPMITGKFDFKENRSMIPVWEEELIFEHDFNAITKRDEDSQVVILFEVIDPMSFAEASFSYDRFGSEGCWNKIAWAFLKPLGCNDTLHTDKKVRLQLYKPRRSFKKYDKHRCEVYAWWQSNNRDKYPSSLFVTVTSVSPPKIKSVLYRQLTVKDVYDTRSDSQEHSHTRTSTAVSLPKWARLAAQSCKIPNEKMFETETSENGCFYVAFSSDGKYLACVHSEEYSYPVVVYEHANASKESPILLLLDNHTSHLSVEAIDMAVDNGIMMISFPPHCSHRMQPLDVSVFGPFKKMFHTQCQAWMKNHIGRVLELHHIAPIADKCLDASVTPKNIKSGFRATGIYPFDPNVFTAEDFLAADLNGENQCTDDDNDDPDSRRVIMVSADVIETVANEEVTTSEMVSTSSAPSTSAAFLRSALQDVGPLKHDTPAKKSKRGHKPMETTILTSPENVASLHKKAEDKRAKQAKKDEKQEKQTDVASPKKRSRRALSMPAKAMSNLSDEEEDFCIICKGAMPKKLNRNNAIHCNVETGKIHVRFLGHKTFVYSLSWSNDDCYLLSASADQTARIWDVHNRIVQQDEMLPHPAYVYCAKYGPDNTTIVATGCYDHIARIWANDKRSRERVLCQELEGHEGFVNSVVFQKNGDLITADSMGMIIVWSARKNGKMPSKREWCIGRRIKVQEIEGVIINTIVLHPLESRLLVHSRNSGLRMLDLATGIILQRYNGLNNQRVQTKACISPCGSLVFCGGEDSVLNVWHLETGEHLAKYTNERDYRAVTCVDYHPYDHVLAYSGFGGPTAVRVLRFNKDASNNDVGLIIIGEARNSRNQSTDRNHRSKSTSSSGNVQQSKSYMSRLLSNELDEIGPQVAISDIFKSQRKERHYRNVDEVRRKVHHWPESLQLILAGTTPNVMQQFNGNVGAAEEGRAGVMEGLRDMLKTLRLQRPRGSEMSHSMHSPDATDMIGEMSGSEISRGSIQNRYRTDTRTTSSTGHEENIQTRHSPRQFSADVIIDMDPPNLEMTSRSDSSPRSDGTFVITRKNFNEEV